MWRPEQSRPTQRLWPTACAQAAESTWSILSSRCIGSQPATARRLDALYVIEGGRFGHMSARGNHWVASLVAAALKQGAPRAAAQPQHPMAGASDGVGRNFIAEGDWSQRATAAKLTATVALVSKTYTLSAAGEPGEHYIALPVEAASSGRFAFSLMVRPAGTHHLRLQLLDRGLNGVFGDFNLEDQTTGLQRLGVARGLSASNEPSRDGWRKLTLVARLPQDGARVLIQLADRSGGTGFPARG
jgi:hypothetical protein